MVKASQVLFKRYVTRWLTTNWFSQGKLKIKPTKSKENLESLGFEVTDIHEFLNTKENVEFIRPIGLFDPDIPKDENHPEYKQTPCYMFKDNNVLLEGLEQAKALTNTVEISEGLPLSVTEKECSLNLSDVFHSDLIKRIKVAAMFDATQEKLPRKKLPEKPMFKLKREWGLTAERKVDHLCKTLALACEQFSNDVRNNSVIYNAAFVAPFEAFEKNIQFDLKSEVAVMTKNKLQKIENPSVTESIDLPDLYPVDCTISLTPFHFYSMETVHPVNIKSKWPYVQLAFLHFNNYTVKNLHEEPVTESQIVGRSLLKGFTMAVTQARALYGEKVEVLPDPIVVPVVQTDGKWFHFSIYQLNTTVLDKNSGLKNIFWQSPMVNLYEDCEFRKGRPIFEGYNPTVINRLVTLYNIQ